MLRVSAYAAAYSWFGCFVMHGFLIMCVRCGISRQESTYMHLANLYPPKVSIVMEQFLYRIF